MPELNFTCNPVTFKVLGVIFSANIEEILLLNYENKLVEMRKLLNVWARRHLTPLGKVIVIKKSAFVKINYVFMNLPIQMKHEKV